MTLRILAVVGLIGLLAVCASWGQPDNVRMLRFDMNMLGMTPSQQYKFLEDPKNPIPGYSTEEVRARNK